MGTHSGLPFRFIGFAEHCELELLVKAGLSPMAAIQSCTKNNAEALGEARDYGTLEPGKQADFLILDQDPLKDMRHTQTLDAVWQSGRQVESIVGNKS